MEIREDPKSCPDVLLRLKRSKKRGSKKKRNRLNSAQNNLVAGQAGLNKPHFSSLTHDDSPTLALNHGQDVHDGASTAQPPKKSKYFVNERRKKKSKSSLKGVSHPSPKRRRIGTNLRFWLWRNRRKVRCRRLWWSSVSGRRKVQSRLNRLNARRRPRKRNEEVERHCSQDQRELSERTVALAEDRPVKENSLLDPTTSTPEVRAESLTTTDVSRSSTAAGQSGLNKTGQTDGKDSSVQFCEQSTSSPVLSSCNDSQTLHVRSVDRDIIIRPVNEKAPKELLLSPERHREASRRPEQRTATLTLQEPNTDTHTCGTGVPCKKACRKKRNGEVERHCSQDQRELSERTVALADDRPVKENSLLDPATSTPEVRAESLTTTDISRSAAAGQSGLNKTGQADGKGSSVRLCKRTGSTAPSSCNDSQTVKVCSVDRDIIIRHGEASRRPVQRTVSLTLREPNTDTHTGGTSVPCQKARRKKEPSPAAQCRTEELRKEIHEFLDGFYRRYGSFFALQRTDTLSHLRSKFRMDSNESQLRKNWVCMVAAAYQVHVMRRPVPDFQVVYKKHLLTLEDLSSLENDNWLNDQVINMYGELIMESSRHKVHFFNSFFYRQLINKGYEGVRRWTKQVDVFSKQLLLVPVHLDVHWCLVAVNTVEKRLHLYDSQGTVFKRVARDVMNYLRMEAKERRQTTLQKDWTMSVKAGIPQQTNENDCGVFVLEYCRCLALGKPLDFSQNHIPRVRQRIYKELCDCKIQED